MSNRCYVSDISIIETLGYHKISLSEKNYLKELFLNIPRISINSAIIDHAVKYKQSKKMTIGDSIIAATAKVYNIEPATKNIKDFSDLKLPVFDQFQNSI
jgi:hypothetical protein